MFEKPISEEGFEKENVWIWPFLNFWKNFLGLLLKRLTERPFQWKKDYVLANSDLEFLEFCGDKFL